MYDIWPPYTVRELMEMSDDNPEPDYPETCVQHCEKCTNEYCVHTGEKREE